MFVPYEIDTERAEIFNVYRSGDRCVCGCSAIATSREYPNVGYCDKCAEKRQEFTKKIIGNIEFERQDEISAIILNPIEKMRKLMLSEIIFYIIDSYFTTNDKYSNNFSEPYTDSDFVRHCLCQKNQATEKILCNFELLKSKNSKKAYRLIESCQEKYLKKINDMSTIDLEVIDELSKKNTDIQYMKKFKD